MSQPYNPYAAPQTGSAGAASPPPYGQPQPWEPGEVLSLAWARFQENWLVLVLAYFIYMLVTQIVGQGPVWLWTIVSPPEHPGPFAQLGVQGPSTLFATVVGAFLQVGFLRICLEVVRGGTPQIGALFAGGDRFLPLLGANILVGLVVGLGMLLLIVPGIIIALSLFPVQFYVVDAKMGPMEAMRASRAATKGHKGNLFGLSVAYVGIALLGLLACCVGIVAAVPLCYLASAIVYVRLSGLGTATADVRPRG